MAIVGTGIDICEVPRVQQVIERFGERFLKRVFTESERAYCDSKKNRVERYAARFAAKKLAAIAGKRKYAWCPGYQLRLAERTFTI